MEKAEIFWRVFKNILDVNFSTLLSLVVFILPMSYETILTITSLYSSYPDGAARFIMAQHPLDQLNLIYLASTFFTSIWLWIYLAITSFIKIGPLGGSVASKASSVVRVKRFPLVALNLFGLLVFTICYLAYCLIMPEAS